MMFTAKTQSEWTIGSYSSKTQDRRIAWLIVKQGKIPWYNLRFDWILLWYSKLWWPLYIVIMEVLFKIKSDYCRKTGYWNSLVAARN